MLLRFRQALCCALMIFITMPAPLFAAETNAAMVYARGTTWVNGTEIPKSSVLFAGDMVQTKADSAANITLAGATVTVLPNSLVRFEGGALQLQHGGITVLTSSKLPIRTGDMVVTPTSADWTEFWIGETDDDVTVMARKGDVTVSDSSGTTTLAAGQETTREKKKKRRRSPGAVPAASGSVLDSKAALIAGIAAVGTITTIVLLQREDPISPSRMGP